MTVCARCGTPIETVFNSAEENSEWCHILSDGRWRFHCNFTDARTPDGKRFQGKATIGFRMTTLKLNEEQIYKLKAALACSAHTCTSELLELLETCSYEPDKPKKPRRIRASM